MLTYNDKHLPDPNPSAYVQFKNCRLLRNHEYVEEHLWIHDGAIVNPEPIFFELKRSADVQIDCKGAIIAPGFIDLQINGGYGVDFSSDADNLEEKVRLVAKNLVANGVTAFCPTVISSTPACYKNLLPKYRSVIGQRDKEATILGLHLEGPFINTEKKGAHPIKNICSEFTNGFSDVERMYGASNLDLIRMITLAPELSNASDVIRELTRRKICVSLGHSSATLTEGEQAVLCGAACLTHLFNAMPPFHHRDPGLVGLLTSEHIPSDRTFYYGVIADGIHTHDSALRIAYRTHAEGLVLVTDAFGALGLGDGIHRLGDITVNVSGKRATVFGTDTLVGNISPLDYCVRHLLKAARCTSIQALESASLHPAQCLNIATKKGTLNYEADADFVMLDDQLNVLATFIKGKRVWCKTVDI